jgi:sodium-dependent dicarboxylate transporter 2/3/5
VTRDPARRESIQHLIGLAVGPTIAALIYFAPLPFATSAEQTLAAILAWVVCYWIAEPIPLPVTALFGAALCVLADIAPAKVVFASFAHPVIFLFIGSFLLAEAVTLHGVDRRFASWVLSLPWVGEHPARVLLAIGTITAVISMWISNAATTALMLPIALGIVHRLEEHRTYDQGGLRTGLLLLLSYAATAGGLATPIGTPPNLVGMGFIAEQAGMPLSFATWMAIGCPLAFLTLVSAWTILCRLHPGDAWMQMSFAQGLQAQRKVPGRWTRGQVNASAAFGIAVSLWLLPAILSALWGFDSPVTAWFKQHLPSEVAAILAAALLFVLPVDARRAEFTLSWQQATKINWGVILLFGGGLAFGDLIVRTGLSRSLGQGFVSLFGSQTVWSFTAESIVLAVLVSELVSNTATASMVIPLVISIAQAAGLSPVPPALGACFAASFGFALPTSTAPNAIVYGTGLVPLKQMIRTGLMFDLLGALLIWLTLRLLCPLLGLV